MNKNVMLQMVASVPIEYQDIMQWLTECKDPNILRTISTTAAGLAQLVTNQASQAHTMRFDTGRQIPPDEM